MNRIRKCEICKHIKKPQEMLSLHICKECAKNERKTD